MTKTTYTPADWLLAGRFDALREDCESAETCIQAQECYQHFNDLGSNCEGRGYVPDISLEKLAAAMAGEWFWTIIATFAPSKNDWLVSWINIAKASPENHKTRDGMLDAAKASAVKALGLKETS